MKVITRKYKLEKLNIPGLMSPPVRKTETVIPDKKKLQIPDFGNRLDL